MIEHRIRSIPIACSSIESLRTSGSSKHTIRVFNRAVCTDPTLIYWVTGTPSAPVGWAAIRNELEKVKNWIFWCRIEE